MHRLRFLIVVASSLFRARKRSPLEPFHLDFWLTPFDAEFTRSFTHTYFSMMALGRWNFVLTTTDMRKARREGWVPLTFSEHIRYKRSVRVFQKVRLTSRLIYWDQKMTYFEQRFETKDGVAALGYACGALRGKKGFLSPLVWSPALAAATPPEMPEVVKHWRALDDHLLK